MSFFLNIWKEFLSIPAGYLLVIKITCVLLVTFLISLVERFVYNRIIVYLKKSRRIWDDTLVYSLHRPLHFLIWLSGIVYAAELFRTVNHHVKPLKFLDAIWHIGIIIFFLWFVLRFIKTFSERIVHPDYVKKPRDKTTVDAVSKLLSLTLVLMAILAILQDRGIPISGVLAFGGGGALIVGLAAKDLIANFFGGLMIYMDRPFSVGEWIASPDKEIEGTVEQIGWRLTRIRTFDQRPLYVPNSIFSTVAIMNPSRMTNRRIKTVIGVRYSDVNNLPGIVADIEDMLRNHPEIDTRKTLFAKLVNLGDSSLDIMIYTFTKTTQWVKFQAIQEDIFLKVVDIIYNKYHAEMSPTTYYLDMRGGLPIELQNIPELEGKQHAKRRSKTGQ